MKIIYELARRDGWECQICGKKFARRKVFDSSRSAITVDHIRPQAFGGSDESSNLRLAHRHCNSGRHPYDNLVEWYDDWMEDNVSCGYDTETLRAMSESDNFRGIVLGLR